MRFKTKSYKKELILEERCDLMWPLLTSDVLPHFINNFSHHNVSFHRNFFIEIDCLEVSRKKTWKNRTLNFFVRKRRIYILDNCFNILKICKCSVKYQYKVLLLRYNTFFSTHLFSYYKNCGIFFDPLT